MKKRESIKKEKGKSASVKQKIQRILFALRSYQIPDELLKKADKDIHDMALSESEKDAKEIMGDIIKKHRLEAYLPKPKEEDQRKIKGKSATKDEIEAVALKFAEENGTTYEWEIFQHFKRNGYSVTMGKFRPTLTELAERNKLMGIRTGSGSTSKILYAIPRGRLDITKFGMYKKPYITINELIEIASKPFSSEELRTLDMDTNKIVILPDELKTANPVMFKEMVVKQHYDGMKAKTAFIEVLSEVGTNYHRTNETGTEEEDEKIEISLNGFSREELQYISEHNLLDGVNAHEFVNNLVKSAVQNATNGKLEIEQNGRISVTELANMAGNLLGLIQRR